MVARLVDDCDGTPALENGVAVLPADSLPLIADGGRRGVRCACARTSRVARGGDEVGWLTGNVAQDVRRRKTGRRMGGSVGNIWVVAGRVGGVLNEGLSFRPT